jgi:hypothetical protein
MTVLVKPSGWNNDDLSSTRRFTNDNKFDLVWVPDIREDELNRHNRLPEPVYFLAVHELLQIDDPVDFYQSFPHSITPPTDDHPFYFHFFKWEQTPEVIATIGHIWQPFGGSGYLVLFALLLLTLILSVVLILLPLIFFRKLELPRSSLTFPVFVYFSCLGIAFLFVELPLIQRLILLLGHPTYAFTIVVFSVLLFSGIGSSISRSRWLPKKWVFLILVFLAFLNPIYVNMVTEISLGLSMWIRVIIVILSLAPLGLLMGMPFPFGLAWLEKQYPALIPWAWAVNGCASVIASVLAAIISLEFGFSAVFLLGALAYTGATAVFIRTFSN